MKKRKHTLPKLPTIEQFAKEVGASVASVEGWRSKGMPSTVEKPRGGRGRPRVRVDRKKAKDWMVANKVGGFGKVADGEGVPNDLIGELGIAGAVERARISERDAHSLYTQAKVKKDNVEIRAAHENWHDAAQTLARMEKLLDQRHTIERDIHIRTQTAVQEWCAPKRAFIESLAHAYASRANPGNVKEAEAVFREVTAALLKQLSEPVNFSTATPAATQ